MTEVTLCSFLGIKWDPDLQFKLYYLLLQHAPFDTFGDSFIVNNIISIPDLLNC